MTAIKSRLKKEAPRLRAIILVTPIALAIFALDAFITSFRTLKNPGVYLLIFTLFFTTITFASAPKADLSFPIAPVTPHIQTEYEYVTSLPHGDIVWRIYNNESSQGTNPFIYCQKKGMFNDVGYDVADKHCFISKKEEFLTVSNWFDIKLQKHTLGQSLCLYNEGILEDTCRYSDDFLNI